MDIGSITVNIHPRQASLPSLLTTSSIPSFSTLTSFVSLQFSDVLLQKVHKNNIKFFFQFRSVVLTLNFQSFGL